MGVVLWDVAARKRPVDAPIAVNEGRIVNVAFSPDGRTVAARYSGDRSSGAALLDVDFKSWARRAGSIANRNFTRKEWRELFPEMPYRAVLPDLPVPPDATPE